MHVTHQLHSTHGLFAPVMHNCEDMPLPMVIVWSSNHHAVAHGIGKSHFEQISYLAAC